MSYIGTQQGTASPVLLDSITVVNGQAAYTMQKGGVNYSPASTLVTQVSLNGIIQAPNTSFTIDGSTITFASNLVTGDVIDYILVREPTTGTIAPVDGSVTNSKIVSMAASKLTGALPAIDGSALTGVAAGSNIIEVISGVCDGSTHTVNGTAYTFPNITAEQTTSTSYADVTGSSFTYTPPSDATRVEYHFQCLTAPVASNRKFNHWKFYIDSDEVLYARSSFGDFSNSYEEMFDFRWVIGIGGVADTNVGRLATWTANKTMKMSVRSYSSNDTTYLHENVYWDGTAPSGGHLRLPTLTITAYK